MGQRDNRIDVDLSIDRSAGAQIAENTRNVPFKSFTVVALSAGATMEIGAGQGAPYFPYNAGDGWEITDPCDAVTDGLYIRNDAQPGATAIIQLGISAEYVGAR